MAEGKEGERATAKHGGGVLSVELTFECNVAGSGQIPEDVKWRLFENITLESLEKKDQ